MWCTGATSFTGTEEGVCLGFETGGVDDQENVYIQGGYFFLNQVFPMMHFTDNDEVITPKIRVMSSVYSILHK